MMQRSSIQIALALILSSCSINSDHLNRRYAATSEGSGETRSLTFVGESPETHSDDRSLDTKDVKHNVRDTMPDSVVLLTKVESLVAPSDSSSQVSVDVNAEAVTVAIASSESPVTLPSESAEPLAPESVAAMEPSSRIDVSAIVEPSHTPTVTVAAPSAVPSSVPDVTSAPMLTMQVSNQANLLKVSKTWTTFNSSYGRNLLVEIQTAPDADSIILTNELDGKSSASFNSATNTLVANDWKGYDGNTITGKFVESDTIIWSNSSVWTALDLTGIYEYLDGHDLALSLPSSAYAEIKQEGSALTFVNERLGLSPGRFFSAAEIKSIAAPPGQYRSSEFNMRVSATAWSNLEGELIFEGGKYAGVKFSNGSTWRRIDFSGNYMLRNGLIAPLVQNGKEITINGTKATINLSRRVDASGRVSSLVLSGLNLTGSITKNYILFRLVDGLGGGELAVGYAAIDFLVGDYRDGRIGGDSSATMSIKVVSQNLVFENERGGQAVGHAFYNSIANVDENGVQKDKLMIVVDNWGGITAEVVTTYRGSGLGPAVKVLWSNQSIWERK